MNRRSFLKLASAVTATPVLRPVGTRAADPPLTNWAGNLTYSTSSVSTAASLDDVRRLVQGRERMRVLGSRHCFNAIADSKDHLLSLAKMDQVRSIDTAARTVTVAAGIRYGQLCPLLDTKGLALHNLASLPHISIAGACATATHGSGEQNGNLATGVTALTLVNAAGEVVTLSRSKDRDTFPGAVVNLGALGAVAELTLEARPTFAMRQHVYEGMPLAAVKEHFDEIQASGYSVSLFTDWQHDRVNEVWIKSRVDVRPSFEAPPEFFGATRATRNLHPIAELSAENCTEQLGVPGPWYERLPHFRMGFTPSAGKELQSEYFVPRSSAVDAILAVARLRDQVSPHLMISEIRTIAADDLWMSPCYRRPSVAIHFTWKPDWPAVSRVLPVIERELSAYGVRPHWGKLFAIEPAVLKERYERLPEFANLCRRFDPKGKFRNDFIDRYVPGA
jgi:xylitol oxidase